MSGLLSFKAELAVPDASSLADPTMALSRRRVAEAVADGSGRVYRVYCDGVFDLFHLAHMRMFEQAKKALGPASKVHLIAGVCSDELGTKRTRHIHAQCYAGGEGSERKVIGSLCPIVVAAGVVLIQSISSRARR